MFAGPQAESEIRRHLLGIQMNPKQEHAIMGRERVPVPEIVAVKTNHGWAVIEVPHMLLEFAQQLHDQAERLSRDVQTVEIPMEDAPPESIEEITE
jgi:hypothetical protein